MPNVEQEKRASAEAALKLIEPGMVLGVGTGSTVNYLIELLSSQRIELAGAVSSSEATSERLKAAGIAVLDLNSAGPLPLYLDGADECDAWFRLIKGGGAALTREKIIAQASENFTCLIDASKRVDVLGDFPLPVEVIPMARSLVAREIVKVGGAPVWRQGTLTDNGNWILDVHNLKITDPLALEREINQWPGVVSVGLFARRGADRVICAGKILEKLAAR